MPEGRTASEHKHIKIKKAAVLTAVIIMSVLCMIVCGAGICRNKKASGRRNLSYTLSDETGLSFSNADSVIGSIRTSLKNHDVKIYIGCNARSGEHMEDVSPLIGELVYCALVRTGEIKEGDYIRYQYGGYKLSYGHEELLEGGGYHYSVCIEPSYYSDLAQEQELDAKIKEIQKELGFGSVRWLFKSDTEKVTAIEDYICEHVQYDMVHRNKKDVHLKSTAFSAAVYERATCQGYAELFYRLCMEEGIDCRIITGDARDPEDPDGDYVYHAWNLVRLNGKYYNVDTTWDAELQDRSCFLKTDAEMPDHIRSEEYASEAFYAEYPMG